MLNYANKLKKGKKSSEPQIILFSHYLPSVGKFVRRNFDPLKYFTLLKSHHNKLLKISMH